MKLNALSAPPGMASMRDRSSLSPSARLKSSKVAALLAAGPMAAGRKRNESSPSLPNTVSSPPPSWNTSGPSVPFRVWLAAVLVMVSSSKITPCADVVPSTAPADGPARATSKRSLFSPSVSGATFTVMILLVSPGAKLTLPEGAMPPKQSAAPTGLGESPPADHCTVLVIARLPDRCTAKL